MKADGIQSAFLTRVTETGERVNLITVNGYQMRGRVAGHDRFALLLEADGVRRLVYKHAVSTITPEHAPPAPGNGTGRDAYPFGGGVEHEDSAR